MEYNNITILEEKDFLDYESNNKKIKTIKLKNSTITNDDEMIYKGENTNYEVINLKPDQTYIFKLKIIKKDSSKNKEKEIQVTTLSSPHSILSINSLDIANKKILKILKRLQNLEV